MYVKEQYALKIKLMILLSALVAYQLLAQTVSKISPT